MPIFKGVAGNDVRYLTFETRSRRRSGIIGGFPMAKPTHPLLRRALYILGRLRERRHFRFQGCRFDVHEGVLNPTVFGASLVFARACLGHAPEPPARVLELGSGCGLAAVLLARAGHTVTAVDIDVAAVKNTALNALTNSVNLTALESRWDESLPAEHRFAFVVTNPPFLTEEPPAFRTALFGGSNLELLRGSLEAIRRRLAANGRALVLTSDRTGRAAFLEAVRDARLRVAESHEDKHWLDTYFIDILEAA